MDAGSIVANLKLKTQDFQRNIDQSKKKLHRLQDDLKNVGTRAAVAGGAMAVGLGKAVKTAANFEEAMSGVKAVSGAGKEQMEEMTKTAEELGSSTRYSATEAAQGMQYLSMAGFKAKETVKAMPGVLNMAAAGNMELGRAADVASNIMSGFSIEAKNATEVSDVLAKTFTNSNTTLSSLGETMKYVAPAAESVGWSLEEMAAAAGKLGDAGIQGSQAGTMLRSAVTKLASPTKKGKEALEKYNIEITDSEGNMKSFGDIITQMKDKFGDLSDAERNAAMKAIFGQEAMSGMLALMKDPKALKEFTNELENSGGTAEKVAEEKLNNLNGQITKLKSALEGAAISIGKALLPAIKDITAVIKMVVDWFNNLDESTKQTIATIAGISSVVLIVGGAFTFLLGFLPNIISGFSSVTTAAKMLGTGLRFLATNPIGIVIAAIGALIAIFIKLYRNNEEFRKKVKTVWNAIVSFMKPVLKLLKDIIQSTWNDIKVAIKAALNIIEGIIKAFVNLLTGNWKDLWNNIKTILSNSLTLLWKAFKLWGFGKFVKLGGRILLRLYKVFKGKFDDIFNIVRRIIGNILGRFSSAGTRMKNLFLRPINAIKGYFQGLYNSVMGTLRNLVDGIARKVSQAKNWLSNLNPFKRHSPSLVDNVKAGVDEIIDQYKNLANLEIKPPQIGSVKPGRIDVQGIVANTASGESKNESNYNAPLVNVEHMETRDDQDVREISSELYNLQRNADRKRGR